MFQCLSEKLSLVSRVNCLDKLEPIWRQRVTEHNISVHLFSERKETYIVQSCSAMSFWVLIKGANGEKVEVHVHT